MPFIVGVTLVVLGGIVAWGGFSGRFSKMAAAMAPSGSSVQTTAFTGPDTGFQQLSGLTAPSVAPGDILANSNISSSGGVGTANLPTWETTNLDSLAAQGSLSGVPAIALAGIDQAESSGQGGYVNSSGYGGWFGLGQNTAYPTGRTDSLLGNAPSDFIQQAKIAAGEFASLLKRTGGNAYQAESLYQGGSSEGDSIFTQIGVPQSIGLGNIE